MTTNWFAVQEARWRSAASAIWTFLLNLCVFVVFLLVWIFAPLYHVINICDYFWLLFTFQAWFVMIFISMLSALFVKIHFQSYSVVCDLKCSRWHVLVSYFHPRNWFYAFCSSCLSFLIAMFMTKFSTKTYSIFTDCTSEQGTFRCLNETYFVFLMFALCLGFINHLFSKVNHSYTLCFPFEQQGRFLLFKVNFVTKVTTSGKQSFNFLKYFIIFYYFLGVLPRYFITVVSDYPFCDGDLIGFNNFAAFVSVAWTLWIFGTLLLLFVHLSWHLFNSYTTKVFNFPVDSVFPEDDCKLLTKNLNTSQPLLVQHLAFQYLNVIAKYSVAKRKQLFVMKFEKQGKRLLKWNVAADECLARILELTNNLKNHHQNLSKSQKDSSAESNRTQPTTDASTSMLRRRPLSDATNVSQPNGYFEVSARNATTDLDTSLQLDRSAFQNNSMIVPTPKLWAKQQNKRDRTTRTEDSLLPNQVNKPERKQKRSLLTKFTEGMQHIPVIAYFVKKMPDREVGNIFSNHYIYKWAIESLSLLVAASLTEDDYGFVQQRIGEVLVSLFDLLAVLEKNNKLQLPATSPASFFLLRQQHQIKAETKAAIYRITNTFSDYLETITLSSEHQRRLKSFLDQKQ